MKKAFNFLAILFCTVLFGLAGCGDIYANMRITTNLTNNTLDIVLDPLDLSTYSTTFTATVEGYSDGMDTQVDFEYAPHGVVTAEVINEVNGVNTIKVTAIADADNMPISNTTKLTIVSRENNQIKSTPITVNLRLPANALSMREDATPYVIIGDQNGLVLDPEKLINFEPFYATERDVEFTFADTYDGLEIKKDETTGYSVLYAKGNAEWGVVKLTATAKLLEVTPDENAEDDTPTVISCPVYILVHNNVTSDDIVLKYVEDDSEVDDSGFSMATSMQELSKIKYNVEFSSDSGVSGKDFTITSTISNTTIANVFEVVANNTFEINAFDTGEATLTVTLSLQGNVGEDDIVLRTFHKITRVIPIIVEEKVYDVLLSTGTNSLSNNELNIEVVHQDGLQSNSLGTKINVAVLPNTVADKTYQILLYEAKAKDGSSLNVQDVLEDIVVQHYVGGNSQFIELGYVATTQEGEEEIYKGQPVDGDEFYICYTKNRIGDSFVLRIMSNSSGEYNTITCTIRSSATDFSVFVNEEEIKEDTTINVGKNANDIQYSDKVELTINYETVVEGSKLDLSDFEIEIKDSTYVELVSKEEIKGNPVFTLRGKEQGSTTITISCNKSLGGIYKTYSINVLVPTTSVQIADTVLSGKVVERKTQDDIQSIKMTTKTKLNVELVTNPSFATISDVTFKLANVNIDYADSLTLKNNNGSWILTAGSSTNRNIKPFDEDDNVMLVCEYTYWEYSEATGVWEEKNAETKLQIITYIPVENFTWDDNKLQKNITIYNIDALSEENKNQYAYSTERAIVKSSTSTKTNVKYELRCDSNKFDDAKSELTFTDDLSYTLYVQRTADINGNIDFTFYGTLGQTFTYTNAEIQCNGKKVTAVSGDKFTLNGITYYLDSDNGYLRLDKDRSPVAAIDKYNNTFFLRIVDSVTVDINFTVTQQKLSFPINCTITILQPEPISDIQFNDITDGTTKELESNKIHLEKEGLQPSTRIIQYSALPYDVINSNIAVAILDGTTYKVLTGDSIDNDYIQIIKYQGTQKLEITALKPVIQTTIRFFSELDIKKVNNNNDWTFVTHWEIQVTVADGTQGNPFEISSSDDLLKLAEYSKDEDAAQLNKFYKLTNSIDMRKVDEWTRIEIFKGSLDFDEYQITGLRYSSVDNFGLFGKLDGATLKLVQLNLSQPTKITINDSGKDYYLGLLAGEISDTTITGIEIAMRSISDTVNFDIKSANNVYFGGVVGKATDSTIENINIRVNAEFTINATEFYAGGVAGEFGGTIAGINNINAQFSSESTHSSGAVGGVVGKLVTSSSIKNLTISGNINMPGVNNIGGVAGESEGDIIKAESSMKIYGANYVGGIVGSQTSGNIRECVVECYDSDIMKSEYIYSVRGQHYVGGIVGCIASSTIEYTYILSYIKNRTMVDIKNTSINTNNAFYGDIIGADCVGGIAGYAKNTTITSSFASAQLNARNGENTTTAGGLVGKADTNVNISYSFANATMFVFNNYSKCGQLIGNADNSTKLTEVYARVILNTYTIEGNTITTTRNYNPISGTLVDENISNVVYYDEDTPDAFTNLTGGLLSDFTTDAESKKWISADNGLFAGENYNDNSLILYNSTGDGILYKASITGIKITEFKTSNDGTDLPKYFAYNTSGIVVNLDKVDTDLALSDLITLQFSPRSIDLNNCKVNFYSTDTTIVDVSRADDVTLRGAKLIFTGKTGVVSIVIQSKQNLSVKAVLELNVIPGISSIDYLGKNDTTLVDKTTYINIQKSLTITPSVTNKLNSIHLLGVTYSIDDGYSSYIQFVNGEWVSNQINLTIQNTSHNLKGLEVTNTAITITAIPYLILTFGGNTTYYSLDSYFTYSSMQFKVYNGITDSYIDTNKTSIYSSDSFDLDIHYTADANCVELCSNEETTYTINERQTITFKDGNNNDAKFYYVITNKYEDENKKGKYSIHFELDDTSRYIIENKTFDFTFIIYNTFENEVFREYQFSITIKPTPVTSVSAQFYQNGSTGYKDGDVPNNVIVPGREGLLQINVTQPYSTFDEIRINSTIDPVTGDKISFGQLLYTNMSGEGNKPFDRYSSEVNTLSRITGKINENNYYNGTIYVSTLIAVGVPENTQFTISITPYYLGKAGTTTYVRVTASFISNARLNPVVNAETLIIAKGGTLQFTLSGTIQNAEVKIDTPEKTNMFENEQQYQNIKADDTKSSFTKTLTLYAELDATGKDGNLPITIQIYPIINNIVQTQAEYTRTINVKLVDYIVETYSVYNVVNNVMQLKLTEYTPLQLEQKIILPTYDDYLTYSSDNGKFVYDNEDDFKQKNQYFVGIEQSAQANLDGINKLGIDDTGESAFYYYKGTSYLSLNHNTSGLDIILNTDTKDEKTYLVAKGRIIKSNIDMMAKFYTSYIYDNELGCYKYQLSTNSVENAILNIENTLPFKVDIVNSSSEECPYLIEDVDDLRQMEADVNYILTRNLELSDWTPLNTAIASLDGNGYTITINSFAEFSGNAALNIGLFDTIASNTIIKNVIVDMSNLSFVNAKGHNSVNYGTIAGVNNGTIYNCDVIVSQDTEYTYKKMNDEKGVYNNLVKLTQFARDTVNSWNQDEKAPATLAIATDAKISNNIVTTNTGGLVGINNGSIANSRVGSLKPETPQQKNTDNITQQITDNQGVQGLNIISGGNLGGLVGYNNGIIASSYFANGTLVNAWDTQKVNNGSTTVYSKTAGIVAEQSTTGRVNGCYALGEKTDSIMSYGSIGGFVHTNAGFIEDCYTIIDLKSPNGAGGFVYTNSGSIYSSFTQCSITTNLANGVFTGIDTGTIETNNTGTIEACYYLLKEDQIVNETEDATGITEAQFTQPKDLYGFVFNKIWTIDTKKNKYPTLIEADNISKYYRSIEVSTTGGPNTYTYKDALGSKVAPYVVHDLASWDRIFNSKNIKSGDYVRIVNDIDFLSSNSAITSKGKYTIILNGNGMKMLNLRATVNDKQDEQNQTILDNFGLFAKLINSTVYNLHIVIDSELISNSRSVGALAGTIAGSNIENIRASTASATGTAQIQGLNAVGGIAGIITSSTVGSNTTTSTILDINSRVSTYAKYQSSSVETPLWGEDNSSISTISYAGGIAGIVEGAKIENAIVTGDVDVLGENAGGIAGYVGGTELNTIRFVILPDATPTIRATHFAGGIVAENNGSTIKAASVAMPDEEQDKLDIAAKTSGNLDLSYINLFVDDDKVVAIGGLVGLMRGENSKIIDAYTRIGVISDNAYVAGGLIGMLTNDTDYIIKNLKASSSTPKELLTKEITATVDVLVEINNCYTTSPVQSGLITGGMIGLVRNVYTTVNPTMAIINNHTPSTLERINDDSYYIGSAIGYMDISNTYFIVANNTGKLYISNDITSTIGNSNSDGDGTEDGSTKKFSANNSTATYISALKDSTLSKMFAGNNSWDCVSYTLPVLRSGVQYITGTADSLDDLITELSASDTNKKIILNDDISFKWSEVGASSLSAKINKSITTELTSPEDKKCTLTITLDTNNFQSLFGVTKNLTLTNINIVFIVNGNYNVEYDQFAFISHSATNLNIRGCYITIKSDTERTSRTITNKIPNSTLQANEYASVGIIAGASSNVLVMENTTINISDVVLSVDKSSTTTLSESYTIDQLNVGGIAGYLNGNATISKVQINGLNIATANTSLPLYIGGIFGYITDTTQNNKIESTTLTDLTLDCTNSNTNYVGGAIGYASCNITIKELSNSGEITLNMNGNDNYVGGALGYSTSINGIETITSDVNIDINNTSNSTQNLYVGGIIGKAEISPSSTEFANLLSKGNISVTSEKDIVNAYIGGLIGVAINKNIEGFIIKGTSLNDITYQNTAKSNRLDIGGLIGYMDQSAIHDSLSNARITATCGFGDTPEFNIGGIVGRMDNAYLDNTNTVTTIFATNSILSNSNAKVDPIVARQGENTNNTITNTIYSPALSGMYTKLTNVTQDDDYSGLIDNEKFIIPSSQEVNDPRMEVTIITDITTLDDTLNNPTASTILLSLTNNTATIFDNNRELTNIRRLAGVAGTTIIVEDDSTNGTDVAFFDSVGSGVLLSNITIDSPNITSNVSGNIAILAAQNNGIIFGCGAGVAPVENATSEKVNTFSANLTSKYKNYETNNVSTIVYTGSSSANISALCANNTGMILNSYAYADIICAEGSTSNVGLLSGSATNAYMINNFAMGRITYINDVSTDTVGGLVGKVETSTIDTSISIVNIYLTNNVDSVPDTLGLAIGSSDNSKLTNIIADNTISMAHTNLNTTGVTHALSTAKLSMQQNSSIVDNTYGLNSSIWKQSKDKNYGYPYLSTMPTVDTGIGSGDSPFLITEAEQFSIASGNGDNNIRLVRDVVYYGGTLTNVNKTFNGNGHTILVDKVGSSDTNYGIFNTINGATISNLSIVYRGEEVSATNFGGLAIEATNGAEISNVAVVGLDTITINSNTTAGGLLSSTTDTVIITNCWTDLDISATSGTLGGLVGTTSSATTITQCFVASSLTLSSGTKGRLVGVSDASTTIEYCYYVEKSGTSTFTGNYSLTGNTTEDEHSTAKVSYMYIMLEGTAYYKLLNTTNYTSDPYSVNWFNNATNYTIPSGKLPYLTNTTPEDYK